MVAMLTMLTMLAIMTMQIRFLLEKATEGFNKTTMVVINTS